MSFFLKTVVILFVKEEKPNQALKNKATDSQINKICESVAKIRDDTFPKIIYRLASELIMGA
jgi:hypothetical protein